MQRLRAALTLPMVEFILASLLALVVEMIRPDHGVTARAFALSGLLSFSLDRATFNRMRNRVQRGRAGRRQEGCPAH